MFKTEFDAQPSIIVSELIPLTMLHCQELNPRIFYSE